MGTEQAILLGFNAITGIAGDIIQGRAATEQSRVLRAGAALTADLATRASLDAIRRGRKEAGRIRLQGRRVQGSQLTAAAGAGVRPFIGSARAIRESVGEVAELDALTRGSAALREALGFKIQAADLRAQGAFARSAARFERRTSLITGGLRAAGAAIQGATLFSSSGTGQTGAAKPTSIVGSPLFA